MLKKKIRFLSKMVAVISVLVMMTSILLMPVSAAEQKTAPVQVVKNNIRRRSIATDGCHNLIAIQKDGTVRSNDREIDLSEFKDVVSVAIDYDWALGLKEDGTVVFSAKKGYSGNIQEELANWTDIVDIAADESNFYGLRSDGTVVAAGGNYFGQTDVSDWKDIVSISVGLSHPGTYTVGVKADGTVVAAGQHTTEEYACFSDAISVENTKNISYALRSDGTVDCDSDWDAVPKWKDIVEIATSLYRVVGLKVDGTVVSHSIGGDYIQSDVSGWKNVAAIAALDECTIGLKEDGSILFSGEMNNDLRWALDDVQKPSLTRASTPEFPVFWTDDLVMGIHTDGSLKVARLLEDSEESYDFSNWTDIVDIYDDSYFLFGLKKDGTVVSVIKESVLEGSTSEDFYYDLYEEVTSWTNVVDLYYDTWDTKILIGVHDDGTVSVVENYFRNDYDTEVEEISKWTDIVEVSFGAGYILGVRSDGTVVATGFVNDGKNANNPELYQINSWKDIAHAYVVNGNQIAGLRKDGTVVIATGSYGEEDHDLDVTAKWSDIVKLYSDGGYLVGLRADGILLTSTSDEPLIQDVSEWKDIVDFDFTAYHAIGLKRNGMVVYCSDFDWELENIIGGKISQWKNIVDVSYSSAAAAYMGLRADGTVAIAYYPDVWLSSSENMSKEAIDEIKRWDDLAIPERILK